MVSIAKSTETEYQAAKRLPGTSELPTGMTTAIMRTYSSDDTTNLTGNGVQAEVAAMSLGREALQPLGQSIIPTVYGWNETHEDKSSKGWILMEQRPGLPLADKFAGLNADKQGDILRQMVLILKNIRSFKLPGSADGYGPLTFGIDGKIVIGKIPAAEEDRTVPYETYGALYATHLKRQLELLDKCTVDEGDWMDDGLRERLERFVVEGAEPLIEAKVKPHPTLVHGDFGECLRLPSGQRWMTRTHTNVVSVQTLTASCLIQRRIR